MPRPHYRSAYACSAIAIALFGGVIPEAQAQTAGPTDLNASMQCDRASEPGRVRCTVEVRVEGGRTLSWADVEILSLPDFASALKGRIGPQDALARDATSTKWALGLVAKRSGQGDVRARVRVVACEAPRPAPSGGSSPPPVRCAPETVEVKAQVSVGS